jgi:hypothetical protein
MVRVAWLDEAHVQVDFDGYILERRPEHERMDGVDVDVEAIHTPP